jgi:hypothetical protein
MTPPSRAVHLDDEEPRPFTTAPFRQRRNRRKPRRTNSHHDEGPAPTRTPHRPRRNDSDHDDGRNHSERRTVPKTTQGRRISCDPAEPQALQPPCPEIMTSTQRPPNRKDADWITRHHEPPRSPKHDNVDREPTSQQRDNEGPTMGVPAV